MEGLGEIGVGSSWVETDDAGLGTAAGIFDRRGVHEHVQGGFGSPIAIPAAERVVANAADFGGDAGEETRLWVAKEGHEVFGEENAGDAIDLEVVEEAIAVDVT